MEEVGAAQARRSLEELLHAFVMLSCYLALVLLLCLVALDSALACPRACIFCIPSRFLIVHMALLLPRGLDTG